MGIEDLLSKVENMGLAFWLGYERGEWIAMLGEENPHVLLPETGGDCSVSADAPKKAILKVMRKARLVALFKAEED